MLYTFELCVHDGKELRKKEKERKKKKEEENQNFYV